MECTFQDVPSSLSLSARRVSVARATEHSDICNRTFVSDPLVCSRYSKLNMQRAFRNGQFTTHIPMAVSSTERARLPNFTPGTKTGRRCVGWKFSACKIDAGEMAQVCAISMTAFEFGELIDHAKPNDGLC